MLTTTAIAFGNEIVAVILRITFGNSVVAQVEPDVSEDVHRNSRYIDNIVEFEEWDDYAKALHEAEGGYAAGFPNNPKSGPVSIRFDRIEDAQSVAPYELIEPAYLPDNVIGFGGAIISYEAFEQRTDFCMVSIWYNIDIQNDFGIIGGYIGIWQEYVGPEASIEMTTIGTVER